MVCYAMNGISVCHGDGMIDEGVRICPILQY